MRSRAGADFSGACKPRIDTTLFSCKEKFTRYNPTVAARPQTLGVLRIEHARVRNTL